MSNKSFPKYRVSSVQAGPVFMDLEASVEKACSLIREAGENGARLVAFPETFLPGYPYWSRYLSPILSARYTKELIKQSVKVPSATTDRLGAAARDASIYVIIGVNERTENANGTLFNTNLLFGPDGRLLGRHRKLVPTYSEKLVWAYGDGDGLRTHDTELGRIGSLMCGENANSLARFALIAEGEQVHVANYLGLPKNDPAGINIAKDIEIRSAAHSFEGKVFNVVSSLVINQSTIDYFADLKDLHELLSSGTVGHTAIYGPTGYLIAGPVAQGVEEILYADIDLEDALLPKLRHDIAGSYNRFDVMQLTINRTPHKSLQDITGAERRGNQYIHDPRRQPLEKMSKNSAERETEITMEK